MGGAEPSDLERALGRQAALADLARRALGGAGHDDLLALVVDPVRRHLGVASVGYLHVAETAPRCRRSPVSAGRTISSTMGGSCRSRPAA